MDLEYKKKGKKMQRFSLPSSCPIVLSCFFFFFFLVQTLDLFLVGAKRTGFRELSDNITLQDIFHLQQHFFDLTVVPRIRQYLDIEFQNIIECLLIFPSVAIDDIPRCRKR